ncbi:MAG: glycosyltransferase family 39 protein [Candidatus Micrarchaeaceae archaeon]
MGAAKRHIWIRENLGIVLLLIFSSLFSFAFFKGPSIFGDDPYYLQYVPQVINGTFRETINVFSLRILMDIPIGLSVKLLGYNDIAAGIYVFATYLITVYLIYLISKEIYDKKAGLISAFLFSIYPLVVKFNSDPDPMLPLCMLLSFSTLFFIYGEGKKHEVSGYILSGIFAFMGVFVNPLAYVYVLFFSLYIFASIIYGFARRRIIKKNPLLFFIGVLTCAIAFGYVNDFLAYGKPFYEITFTNYYYSGAGGPDEIFYTNPSFTFYLKGFFPEIRLNEILSPYQPSEVGFFGYATIAAVLYLLLSNEKRARFPLIWLSFITFYLEFGSMSVTHYFPIYKLMRFTLIASMPMVSVIGIALAKAMEGKKYAYYKKGLAFAAIAFLFVTSLPITYYYYELNKGTMQYVKVEAEALMNAPNAFNSTIFSPSYSQDYLEYYTGFKLSKIFLFDNGAYGGAFMPTCSDIPNDSYIIIPSSQAMNDLGFYPINESWAFDPSECGLALYADIYNSKEISNNPFANLEFSGNIYYKG